MICTATINGVAVEINGTPEECWNFFNARTGYTYGIKLPDIMTYMPSEEFQIGLNRGRKCDPFARHYGNCGAKDCRIIDPACKHQNKTWITGYDDRYYCQNCKTVIHV